MKRRRLIEEIAPLFIVTFHSLSTRPLLPWLCSVLAGKHFFMRILGKQCVWNMNALISAPLYSRGISKLPSSVSHSSPRLCSRRLRIHANVNEVDTQTTVEESQIEEPQPESKEMKKNSTAPPPVDKDLKKVGLRLHAAAAVFSWQNSMFWTCTFILTKFWKCPILSTTGFLFFLFPCM